jgi:hypothetical protein
MISLEFKDGNLYHEDGRLYTGPRVFSSGDYLPDVRAELVTGLRALPGVANDPHTVPDIMSLVDTYVRRARGHHDE